MKYRTINYLIILMLLWCLLPISTSIATENNNEYQGYNKGPSYTNVLPLEKITFINFDEDSIIDDYSYLAAVPTSVFKHDNTLYSHPLLFYQDPYYATEDRERIFNAYEGIEYFMEDWMSYCNNELDKMTLINVPKEKIKQWRYKELKSINEDNPYNIASELALDEWSYSDEAVIAVIDEKLDQPNAKYNGLLKGQIPGDFTISHETLKMQQPEIGVGGSYQSFTIDNPYKYVVVRMYWKDVAIDLDLQLYDNQLGMAGASSKWNILGGAGETVSSYVYNHGKWEVGITYMPTQSSSSSDEGIMKSMFQNVEKESFLSKLSSKLPSLGIRDKLFDRNKKDVDITLYPGIEILLDEDIPYGCRDIEFKLKWNNPSASLGFVILDSMGVETASAPIDDEIVEGIEEGITEQTITIKKLGETNKDDRYKICVFTLNDVQSPLDFTIEYNWQQNITRETGDCLASATEGAVLASSLNAPLLYISKNLAPQTTINTLYKLGVKKIHLINLGNYLSSDTKQKLKEVAKVNEITEYKTVYDLIREKSQSNDVVFSTIDPWTHYYADFPKPVGEKPGSLFIGPAAYIAAHHGTPVLIVDNHPELSQSVVWHTEFWRKTGHYFGRSKQPSVACMVLTGKNVMKFLEDNGYDLPKDKASISTMITVADQFDIGMTWDRTFVGALIPGRFCSSPVDTSYWISRNVFYPSLIFENPALQGPVILENGSKSIVKPIVGKFLEPKGTNLHIIRESGDEQFNYPILHTYNVFLHNFNRDASKHWGCTYTTANGITPYETPSTHSIDMGSTDKAGSFHPDMSETEVTPFYARKAGYSNCFSTEFEATIKNLNNGVIMWMESCHGSNGMYGTIGMWNYDSPYVYEKNPWRAYEKVFISPASIQELILYSPIIFEELGINLPKGIENILTKFRITIPPINFLLVDKGSTADPDVVVMNPDIKPSILVDSFGVDLHIKESKGLSLLPIIGRKYRSYGDDGVVIDPLPGGDNVLVTIRGNQIDDKLENLHSCGVNAVSCLISNTYLHTTLIRHGTTYQIVDPWTTSWYSGIWLHNIPRALALGYTIGEAYEQGISEVGIEYLIDQWWWDLHENVVFFGDPDLRVYTPSTEWDDESKNHWEIEDVKAQSYDKELCIKGHSPFGAVNHPHSRQPQSFIEKNMVIIIISILAIITVIIIIIYKPHKKIKMINKKTQKTAEKENVKKQVKKIKNKKGKNNDKK